ncbi:hypothetical protein ACR03S_01205 [Limimaricola variabilis]
MSKSMKETKQLRPIVRRAASSPSEFRHQRCISAPPVRGYLGKGSKGRKREIEVFRITHEIDMML